MRFPNGMRRHKPVVELRGQAVRCGNFRRMPGLWQPLFPAMDEAAA